MLEIAGKISSGLEESKGLRFWLIYTLAWLAYAASLSAVFLYQSNRLTLSTLNDVSCNVVPAALLGIAIVHVCDRLAWQNRARTRFFAAHAILSFLYASAWCVLTLLCLSIWLSIERGQWTFNRWGSYALQWQFFAGLMAYFTIASAVYVRQIGERLDEEERRAAQLETRAARAEAARSRAELAALHAQLNPHFLFNTLHSLMALVRSDAEGAEQGLERFAQMLRYVLRAQQKEGRPSIDVAFAEEWAFVEDYLALERLRLGARLRLQTDIEPDTLDFQLPAFTLQPLVENAIKHALTPRAQGGTLYISAKLDGSTLRLEVRDDGAGATAARLAETNGLGLRLVRESLAARYGEQAGFQIETAPHNGFSVRLAIPPDITGVNGRKEQEHVKAEGEAQKSWSYAR